MCNIIYCLNKIAAAIPLNDRTTRNTVQHMPNTCNMLHYTGRSPYMYIQLGSVLGELKKEECHEI